jgi:hypothetical protein
MTKEHEGKNNPQIRSFGQETATEAAGAWRWRSLRGSAIMVSTIRKALVVMSQWAHCPWNLESPEAAPDWSVAMATPLGKQEVAGGRCPCLVWKTSQ